MSDPVLAIVAKTKSEKLPATLQTVIPAFLERGWTIAGSRALAVFWRQLGFPEKRFKADPLYFVGVQAPDLCLVLGGDGTLLSAARTVGILGTPILGMNLGSLGFLTPHQTAEAKETVEAYFAGGLLPEQRILLYVELHRDDRILVRQAVMNDVVIHKGAMARIMDFRLRIEGMEAAVMRADGLIVSTPTGSTAYALSAGGPILHPTLDAWVIAPICPHSLTLRPIVVPAALSVSLILGDAQNAHLTLDGQLEFPLAPEDRIKLRKSKHTITLLQNPALPFFSVLQQKLHWNER
ncbi:MAG TPA: NAD(+)/NADH kinase [Holophaga sp.]|nr:NAD(+)/NADH kinase [Holophaga sp.]HPS67791.1 NAD(+)/NADH kinase [Holophaga sp.]